MTSANVRQFEMLKIFLYFSHKKHGCCKIPIPNFLRNAGFSICNSNFYSAWFVFLLDMILGNYNNDLILDKTHSDARWNIFPVSHAIHRSPHYKYDDILLWNKAQVFKIKKVPSKHLFILIEGSSITQNRYKLDNVTIKPWVFLRHIAETSAKL